MEQQDILRQIGFSDGECKVYLALLETGLTTTNIIHEKTGIERRNIYDILNKLIERGVVSYTEENKRRTFSAIHPRALIQYLHEKKHKIDTIESELKTKISSFVEQFEAKKQSIHAEIFRGSEGIKTVWNDMLNYESIYWIGSGNYVPKKFPAFYADWTKRRIAAKRKVFHLARHDAFKEFVKWPLMQFKALPKEFSGQPTVICTFGNKSCTFLFGDEIFVFVIESKDLAQNYKTYFDYLWNNVATKKQK